MKQKRHTRTYESGKLVVVNPKNIRKSTFGRKRIPQRWFIERDFHRGQPIWHVRSAHDKDLTYFQLVEYQKYPNSPLGDADRDGIPNIFDKKPLNIGVRKQVPPTVKKGNTKLTNVIGIFSLPRGYTCPGATPLCKRYCYAENPEYFRPGVVYSRNKNYAWTRRKDFARIMSAMIKNLHVPFFRIHEAGDFYSQAYLEKWKEVARNNPQTRFLAYTKNWRLDFKNLPANFTIRYSSDVSSEHIRQDLPSCYVGVEAPPNFFLCKKRCEPGFCMACWDRYTDVFIPIHSVSKNDVDQMFFKQFNPRAPPKLIGRDIAKGHKRDIIGKIGGLFKWRKQ